MEVTPSVQQTNYDQYYQLIKEKSANSNELSKIIIEVLESQVNTFSEFLHLPEIEAVRK